MPHYANCVYPTQLMLNKLCIPNPINAKPNSALIDPLVPALEEKEEKKREQEEKEHATGYYKQAIYMASHEEDSPALVSNLVPEPTPEEKKDTDRTEEDKKAEDRNLIEITNKDIGDDDVDLDLDSHFLLDLCINKDGTL